MQAKRSVFFRIQYFKFINKKGYEDAKRGVREEKKR